MSPTSPESLLQALKWRYATKKFDPAQTIPATTWAVLEQSLVLAPSSFGLQPWKFLVVTDPAKRKALVPHSWGQTQPAECSHFVVFAARKALNTGHIDHFLARTAEVRGGTVEALAGYRGVMAQFAQSKSEAQLTAWATHQVYIALGVFMTSAAVLGVDACPMEGLVPAEYDKLLGLEGSEFGSVVACAAGYRLAEDKYAHLPKVRFPTSEVIQNI